MTCVSVVRCENYNEKLVKEKVEEALNLIGGLKKFVKKGQKVLIKPNLLSPRNPQDAVTTHPAVIKAVAEEVLRLSAQPTIADIPGYIHLGGDFLEKTGIAKISQELNIPAVPLERDGFMEVKVKEGKHLKSIFIAKMVKDVDVIINLPKAKTHMQTYFSGAVKNMFGCIPSRERKRVHSFGGYEKFSQVVVDIYSTMVPTVNIIDAVVGMEGTGPSQGTPKKLGAILCSEDAVALDWVTTYLMGYKPQEVVTTTDAGRRKLGEMVEDNIKIVGECDIEGLKTNFKKPRIMFSNLPNFFTTVGYRLTEVKPHIVLANCKKCLICANACPVDAIDRKNPKIDTKKCIECFCCHELCPEGAVEIKKALLSKIISHLENKLRM